jgi:hypothetical protein
VMLLIVRLKRRYCESYALFRSAELQLSATHYWSQMRSPHLSR